MSFSSDVYFAREVDESFSPIIMLNGETAIPVTVTIIPVEISEALAQAIDSLRATSKHGLCVGAQLVTFRCPFCR